MIVYRITNKINGKSYIGLTRYSLAHRWSQHCRKDSHAAALSNAIKKYGRLNFTKEILGQYSAAEEMTDSELYFISFYNSVSPNGYNITEGGEAPKHSEESKLKLSLLRKGHLNPAFGKKQSQETKAKRSAALMGRKRSPETIAKIKANHNPLSNKNLTFRRKKL